MYAYVFMDRRNLCLDNVSKQTAVFCMAIHYKIASMAREEYKRFWWISFGISGDHRLEPKNK